MGLTTQKGEIGEAMVLADLGARATGLRSRSGTTSRSTSIARSGRIAGDSSACSASTRSPMARAIDVRCGRAPRWVRHTYERDEVDWIAVVRRDDRLLLLRPLEHAGRGSTRPRLRSAPAANGQHEGDPSRRHQYLDPKRHGREPPSGAIGSLGYTRCSFAGVAQSAEHLTRNVKVRGSIPLSGSRTRSPERIDSRPWRRRPSAVRRGLLVGRYRGEGCVGPRPDASPCSSRCRDFSGIDDAAASRDRRASASAVGVQWRYSSSASATPRASVASCRTSAATTRGASTSVNVEVEGHAVRERRLHASRSTRRPSTRPARVERGGATATTLAVAVDVRHRGPQARPARRRTDAAGRTGSSAGARSHSAVAAGEPALLACRGRRGG